MAKHLKHALRKHLLFLQANTKENELNVLNGTLKTEPYAKTEPNTIDCKQTS